MSDFTAYIGEPDPTKHLCEEILEDEIGFFNSSCTCGEYQTMPVPDRELVVDELMAHAGRAALAGMETVTLTEVWGKESSPGSIHKVEWIAEYIGDSRASHRRLVGPWEPVEDA